jgi:hypothetical protein
VVEVAQELEKLRVVVVAVAVEVALPESLHHRLEVVEVVGEALPVETSVVQNYQL